MKSLTNSLRVALLVFLVVGTIGTAGADVGLITYSSLIYVVTDNLLLLCVVIGVGLGITTQRASEAPSYWRWAAPSAAGLSLLLSFGLLSVKAPLTGYHLLLIAAIGASVGVCALVIFRLPVGEPSPSTPLRSSLLSAGLVIVTIITAALRILLPGTPLLTWIFAPLLLLVTPGLSLAVALLPVGSGWTQGLLYAIPLSLGVYLVSLAWLTRLAIPVTPTMLFAIAIVGTAAGLILRARQHEPTQVKNETQE